MNSNSTTDCGGVLAIEAAVSGGSIALIENDLLIAEWHGTGNVSRTEDLLPNISVILDQAQFEKSRIDKICVSNGPGSYTGIRIGLATALGLARALRIECIGVPLLTAVADAHSRNNNSIVVIPMGRNELCWQAFDASTRAPLAPPLVGSRDDFIGVSDRLIEYDLLMHPDSFNLLTGAATFDQFMPRVQDIGRNLAFSIGSFSKDGNSDLNPSYVRNSKFSPEPVQS